MLRRRLDIRQKSYPIPITVLISTANTCDCDIFVEYGQSLVNVKDYDEMKIGFDTRRQHQLFCFDGCDEADAEQRILCLFTP